MNLVASAIIAGELKEFFEQNKNRFSADYIKVINNLLGSEKIENVTSRDIEIISGIFVEIGYIITNEQLAKMCLKM